MGNQNNFRKKAYCDEGWILTFDDVMCVPSYTEFEPISSVVSNIGPFTFNIPIMSAAMDSVTGSTCDLDGIERRSWVIHRNCPLETQLDMVKKATSPLLYY